MFYWFGHYNCKNNGLSKFIRKKNIEKEEDYEQLVECKGHPFSKK